MKRVLVSSVIIALVLIIPLTAREVDTSNRHHQQLPDEPSRSSLALADVGGTGEDAASTLFISRTFSDKQLSILNSYNAPDHHNGTLNLTQYHIPEWTLYNVTMNIENLTASPEREVVGVQDETPSFRIYEAEGFANVTQLAQGFYDQPHNGSLLNYSIYHSTPTYDPAVCGYAYFTVRSNYSVSSTNLTTLVPLVYVGFTKTWNTSSTSANLTINTVYYAMIDGNSLQKSGVTFPDVQWHSENSAGTFATHRYLRELDVWQSQPYEGLLNYTYIPWNQTSNSALLFSNPQDVSLKANSTQLTNSSVWSLSSLDKNITLINFNSNQSVYVYHNLTLWYKRSATAQTVWDVPVAGGNVYWNVTTTLSYPTFPETTSRFMNTSKMSDWVATGLYNSTTPSVDYGNHTDANTILMCYNMTNGTWTATFTAHNHVTAIDSLETVSILEVLDITALVKDASSANTTTGSTNLTIWQGSTVVFKPANQSVLNGAAHYAWNIAANTSNNGTYRIEVFWANGTEAGYLAKEIVVFYPTTLVAAEYSIDAYTDNSFDISVYYNDTFTPQALTGASANVIYSFDGGINTSMNDQGNGWWNATIFTTAKAPGTYNVTIYAEGFAIENQTAVIWATLIHDTLPLTCVWSAPYEDNITYVEQTNLTVRYQFFNTTSVPGAKVNVTIAGMGTWQLHYDLGSEIYWMQFNGSDFTAGFDTFALNVSAWKTGHEAQFNDTLSLTVRLAPTTMTLDWSSTTIDYLGQIDLTVNYTCDETGSPVPAASSNMNISIDGGTPVALTASGSYWIANLTGVSLDLGPHSVVVQGWTYGYEHQFNDSYSLTVNNVTTDELTIVWNPADVTIEYIDTLNLTVSYEHGGMPVPPTAIVNITIGGNPTLPLNLSGNFWTANLTGVSLDLGLYSVVIQAWAYGYEYQINGSYSITVNNVSTDVLSVVWNPANVTLEYIDRLNLTVSYEYSGNPVPSTAIVNLTIDGHSYDLNWSAGTWLGSILGGDIGPGIWEATISAWLYGYESKSNVTSNVIITLAANSFLVDWEPLDRNVTYVEQVNLTVTYTHDYQPVPGATVTLTLNGTWIHDFELGADDKWHLLLDASVIGLGNWDANVTANMTGYDTGTMSRMMLVRVDPCTATPNWLTTEIYYTHQTDLNVTLLNSLGHPMESTIVNASYSGVNYTLTHVANGVYRLRLNGSDGMGTYPIQIFTFDYGFMNRTVDVQLDIVETPTSLFTSGTRVFEYSGAQGTILYNDGWLVFNVRYEDVDLIALTGATLNVTIDGQVYTLANQPSGNYTLTLYASQLGIGAHSGSFLADIYGYETRNEPFSIDVEPVPAHIEVSLGVVPSVMFLNDSTIVRFDYINDHTGARIDGATTAFFIWPNDLAGQLIDVGRFEVNISSFSLALTDHVLNITLGHVNYTTAQFVRVINVRPVNTRFTASSSFGQYENETVILAVNYTDVDHGQFIHWASVNATIEGTVFQMEYTGEGIYSLGLHITWPPGTYQISFAASAVGCASNYTTAQLAVSEKVTVYLVLSVIGASEGQSGQISATLRENDTENPVNGATIYYEITIVFSNGTVFAIETVYTHLTNDEGVASFAFLIPAGVDYLEIVARFAGTISIWGTDTFLSVPVSPSILAMVMTFIVTPPGMYIVLGFVILAVVSAFYQKRIKPKQRAAMDSLERQLQDFSDLETLRHFMAVYLDQGTCVFYHPFAEERIQPDLISGFIAAITSVYGEIKGDGVKGTLEEIQYHGLRLNSYSGKYVIGILILEGEMTKLLRERLRFFIEMFEKHYDAYLEGWDGLVDCFDSEWVVSNLTGSFNYTLLLPHKFGKKRKVSKLDGKILDLIGTRRDNRREFNLRDLIKPVAALMGASEAKALDKLLAMEDKELIEPISIQTVLQRQGLGLVNGEVETITAPVSVPKPESPPKVESLKPAEKKIDAQDTDDILPEHEPLRPREGTEKHEPRKQPSDEGSTPKDIDKPSPILMPTATTEAKETKAKPAEKRKAPKEEMSEADKFIAEVIDLLAKEKKRKDKSD